MNISAFLLYAIPAIFMTASGSYIPSLDITQSWKFTLYVLCVLSTFVYKYHADDYFKKRERELVEKKERDYEYNIKKLKKEKEHLESVLMHKTIEHGQELNRFARKLNSHLKVNVKNINNETLWSAVDNILFEIEECSDNLQKSLMIGNRKVNRKKESG